MLWPSYMDPHLSLTRQQRKEVHREAWRRWAANKWNLVLYLLLPVAYLLGLGVTRDAAGTVAWLLGAGGLLVGMSRALGMLLWAVLCFVVGGAVIQRYRFAPLVYAALRRHGYDVCPKCGYWLKGLKDETRCPECGAQRQGPPRDETRSEGSPS
ncbi:MAG: hypothetical protein ACYTEI_01815 [Planctomycetota bacterium]